jgi:hypothetical protein
MRNFEIRVSSTEIFDTLYGQHIREIGRMARRKQALDVFNAAKSGKRKKSRVKGTARVVSGL